MSQPDFPTFEPGGVTVGLWGYSAPINPDYFASQATAEEIARRLSDLNPSLEKRPFLSDGSPFHVVGNGMMWALIFPGGQAVNAGMLATYYREWGDHPWTDAEVRRQVSAQVNP